MTRRVPKSEKKPDKTADNSDDDDDNGGFFSNCLWNMGTSCLFGGSDDEEDESISPAVVAVPPTREMVDTSKGIKELEPSSYPEKDTVVRSFERDTIDRETAQVLSQQRKPYTLTQSESKIDYQARPLDWSRWYGGIYLGAGIPVASEETEYNTGFVLKLSTGVLLGGYIEIDIGSEFGWYDGEPLFDRETIIYRTTGDVDSIIQIPDKVALTTGSFGVGVRYVGHFGGFTNSDYFEWGLGGGFQYIRFTESIEMSEQTFRNSVFQKEIYITPKRDFWKPGININGMLSYVPSYDSDWWFELSIGTNILSYSPTEQQPYSMDWIEYESFYNIGLSLKFKVYDFTD